MPKEGTSTIGRHGECDVVLPDPKVSRRHARFHQRGGRLRVEDTSRHGITLNGRKVESATLEPGDELRIVVYTIRVEEEDAPWSESGDWGKTLDLPKEGLLASAVDSAAGGLCGMVGTSPGMLKVFEEIRRFAGSPDTALVLGETGTGKELVARALHVLGNRSRGPFRAVNCSAIASEIAESSLFGHVRGAFTGAIADHAGHFVLASGGTLFLDEVGELTPAMQPRLLRALEQREVLAVGAERPVRVDVRVVAGTNRDLRSEVRAGRFREDLYFRLSIMPIVLPPLRERGKDVLLLAGHFFAEDGRAARLDRSAEEALLAHRWPGNVRELRNVIRRILATGTGPAVDGEAVRRAIEAGALGISPTVPHPDPAGSSSGESDLLAREERRAIHRALEDAGWDKRKAAKRLGIALSTLYVKIRRYGLEPPGRPARS